MTRKGANINCRDERTQRTALMLACKSGYLDLVRALLNNGAEVDAQDKDGMTAFGHAISSEKGENIGLIELLIEKGVDVSRGKFEWLSEGEADRRRVRVDKKLKGFPGLKGDMGSYSEIHKKKKFYEKSSRNMRQEAKLSKKGTIGFEGDPVGIAIRRKFEVVAIKLLKILNNAHKKDSFSGNSYLHLAVIHKNWKVAEFLLQKGLDPNEKNNHDRTTLQFCGDEASEEILKSLIRGRTCELNFKKKKFKKQRKKRKKKRAREVVKKKENEIENEVVTNIKNDISIDPSSSQNASSKGGFLLSQLSLDPDSQGNKLLNNISAKDSLNQSRSKKNKNLWDDLSMDSKMDFKNNLSTDRSTQDLHSVYIQKKNELKTDCRKLEIKLKKLQAENEFINTEHMRNSWSMVLERRLSDINQPHTQEDSLISENLHNISEMVNVKKLSDEKGSSAGKLLDLISNQSTKSNIQEQMGKKSSSHLEDKASQVLNEGCRECLDMLSCYPISQFGVKEYTHMGFEILEFEEEIGLLNSIMRERYEQTQKQIEIMISEIYKGNFELKVYGSFANGLNIPGSDLDLLLIFNNGPTKKIKPDSKSPEAKSNSKHRLSDDSLTVNNSHIPRKYTDPYYPEISQQDFQNKLISDGVMEDLNDKAQQMEEVFSESKYLRNAQVPVVKMVTCEHKGGFPVDVTAHDPRHQGLECVKLVKSLIEKYPALKPIVLILKQLLNLTGLSDPYMGGLSSYGLVVMIVGYFQLIQYREIMRNTREQQELQDQKSKGNWGEESRGSYQKGNRRHSRRGSFANIPKCNKGSQKGFSNLNGHQLGTHSKAANNPKKRGHKQKTVMVSVNTQNLFDRSPDNIGRLLQGFLYFFGFEFHMDFQKVSLYLEDEEPRPTIVSVFFIRNSLATVLTPTIMG